MAGKMAVQQAHRRPWDGAPNDGPARQEGNGPSIDLGRVLQVDQVGSFIEDFLNRRILQLRASDTQYPHVVVALVDRMTRVGA